MTQSTLPPLLSSDGHLEVQPERWTARMPARLRERLGIHELFDAVVCSAEVGMAKPDPAIYRLAAERLGLPPEACVFVDDSEANVRAAEQVGMRGIFFRVDRSHDLRAMLAELGVRPPA